MKVENGELKILNQPNLTNRPQTDPNLTLPKKQKKKQWQNYYLKKAWDDLLLTDPEHLIRKT